ncbi:MAG: FAD-dependent oxidoreductase, partial [Candidatus Binataceae bacterium]
MAESLAAGLNPTGQHDRALAGNVHPPRWINPEPAKIYNLVVIGAGTAGLVTAAGAAGLGAKVALVESNLMGGDCLNFGCVPSKAIIRAARIAAGIRASSQFGISIPGDIRIDFAAVMERMRRLRAELSVNDSAERFRRLGVDVFIGHAGFDGSDSVIVEGKTLCFKRAVIASGSRPSVPPIPGLAEAGYLTNETVFSLTELPRRFAIIGGGPLGCELAQAFARLGAKVVLVEAAPRIMPREDPDAAAIVRRQLERDGIRILTNSNVTAVRKTEAGKLVRVSSGNTHDEIEFDDILVAIGRSPNVEGLRLEAAGVRHDARKGILVDDRLRTSN